MSEAERLVHFNGKEGYLCARELFGNETLPSARSPTWGDRTFRAFSGGLSRKVPIHQGLTHTQIARDSLRREALPQAAASPATATFYTESTITPGRAVRLAFGVQVCMHRLHVLTTRDKATLSDPNAASWLTGLRAQRSARQVSGIPLDAFSPA